uniref:Uncharacterized protein n=1 Tax=Arundo donax TaxID=35708 RepID=A0A0A9AWH7_ARUDO
MMIYSCPRQHVGRIFHKTFCRCSITPQRIILGYERMETSDPCP